MTDSNVKICLDAQIEHENSQLDLKYATVCIAFSKNLTETIIFKTHSLLGG